MATRKTSSKKTTGAASKKSGGKVKVPATPARNSSTPARKSPARKTSAKKTTARKPSRKKESGGLTGFVNRILEKF